MGTYNTLGFSSATIYFAIGIACLVISLRNPTSCGLGGQPTLRNRLYGTGIAYTIIGSSLGIGGLILAFSVIGLIPLLVIAICSGPFTFAWMIVGSVSLWRDGGDCSGEIWSMGMAAVIVSIILVVFNGYSYRHLNDE